MLARTLSAFFLAGVMVAGTTLAATADMEVPAQASSSMHIASPMTAAEIESAQAAPAPALIPPAKGAHTLTNAAIRAAGGIAPCKHEDGSAQVLPCYWNGKVRGNKTGLSYIMMPSKGDDPRQVILSR